MLRISQSVLLSGVHLATICRHLSRIPAPGNDQSVLGGFVPAQSFTASTTYAASDRMLLSAAYGYRYLNLKPGSYGIPDAPWIHYINSTSAVRGINVPAEFSGPNGYQNIFVRDLQVGTTTLVSVNTAGNGGGNSTSSGPVISAESAQTSRLRRTRGLMSDTVYVTGTIAASSSGGIFGPMLKYAGYDMIIFEGKAPNTAKGRANAEPKPQ